MPKESESNITDEMKMELTIATFKEELLLALRKRGKVFACLCCKNNHYEEAGRRKPELILFKDIEEALNVK